MISTWWYVLVFILALPMSVWLLASILGILDRRPVTVPLIQILTTGVFVTLFLLATHRSFLIPISCAFVLVTLLHLVSGAVLRRSLGIPTYSSEPRLETDWDQDEKHDDASNEGLAEDPIEDQGSEQEEEKEPR
ncbi:MAG: hypothetical protein GKR90_07775 [Pseudomonadales bacterium]|nr:hypothetical protein [Pseudomonadales bacterium]